MQFTEKAIQLYSELDALRPLSKEDEARIMQKFRLDWNYHSNHLEGNSLTYGETKALILFGITAQGKPLKDHFEITGHDEAVKWVEEVVKDERPLTESFIRELHKLLLKESYKSPTITPSGIPAQKEVKIGEYKTKPNHVLTKTGETFRFATPEETPALMDDLIQWYRKKSKELDTNPILLAAEFHYKFIRIHPFDDGNGRTARILMNFILMRFGFPPVIIKTEDKANYFSVLRQADAGILEPFLEYIAENLVRSLEIMISGAKGESIEEEDDFEKGMALLKQKFDSSGEEIELLKSKNTLSNLFEENIALLAFDFYDKCYSFNDFYFNSFFEMKVDKFSSKLKIFSKSKEPKEGEKFIEGEELMRVITDSEKIVDEETKEISIGCSFEGLKKVGFDKENYFSLIRFNFENTQFKVSATGNHKNITHSYSKRLTTKEKDEIIKSITNAHKAFIENILQEIKDKS